MSFREFLFGPSATSEQKFPWLFTTSSIDRHGAPRTIPMQVLSLGMGRTGTASVKAALEILGYPTYHGFEIHANKPDCDMWSEAFSAKYERLPDGRARLRRQGEEGFRGADEWRAHFDQLLGHVSAVCDMPSNCFGPELIAAYPEAKIVLVEREVESWYRSWERALIDSIDHWWLEYYVKLDGETRRMYRVGKEGVMECQFRARSCAEYRTNAREVYRRHYAEVRCIMRGQEERSLEYSLGSGWEPLCRFLGKEVPEVEFPHVNESREHDEMIRVAMVLMARTAMKVLLSRVLPAALVVGAVYWQAFLRLKD